MFFAPRYASLVAALCVVASPIATAQVTLNLTTAQQTNCVATTDSHGLALVPGSTDLQATGVVLSGQGCGTNGADFQAVLNVPASGLSNTPVNVTWSAGQQATQCIYGGSAGLSGWPIGTTACQGADCSNPHTTPVTAANPGNYALSITCTNASGFKQGSLSVTAPATAPQPANFTLTPSANPVVGTPFSVNWAVSGADTCVGSAVLGGASVQLPGWTTGNSATSPRSQITASVAGTYTLTLTCSNAVGSTSSAPATVVVGAGGGGSSCPETPLPRFKSGQMGYVPGNTGIRTVDLSSYDNIWGHSTGSDTVVTWPGRADSQPIILGFPRTSYIGAKFHVPTTVSTNLYGFISRTDYNYGADMTMAISTTCGDFQPSTAACVSSGVSGANGPRWQMNPAGSQCVLRANTDYYLNIKYANPSQGTSTCSASSPTCAIGTSNNIGGQ